MPENQNIGSDRDFDLIIAGLLAKRLDADGYGNLASAVRRMIERIRSVEEGHA